MDTNELEKRLSELSSATCSSDVTRAKTLDSPLDPCRASLAQLLSSLAKCSIEDAHESIKWPNNIFNGDLSVTVPRLRPGCKAAEISALSTELVNKVSYDSTSEIHSFRIQI